jgi:hypothetical protein
MVQLYLHLLYVFMTWCLINSAQGQLYLFTFTITPFAALLGIIEIYDPVPEYIMNHYGASFHNTLCTHTVPHLHILTSLLHV